MASSETAAWSRAQGALRSEVERVVDLLRSVRDPAAPAVGRWNLAEVAMHLSQAWAVVPGLAGVDLSGIRAEVPGLQSRAGQALIGDVWDLGDFTTTAVEADPLRDPVAIAGRIEERAAAYLSGISRAKATDLRPWLVEGVTVTQATLTHHLLHETIGHGYDIARADGRRWRIEPAHAAMVLEGFYKPVLAAMDPRAMVNQDAARSLTAVYELHLRGAGRHLFVFDDGALTVEPSGSRPVDCHISVDPAAFLLVALGRRSQWAAIARGQLLAWGRKPWLGPRFRALMRNP